MSPEHWFKEAEDRIAALEAERGHIAAERDEAVRKYSGLADKYSELADKYASAVVAGGAYKESARALAAERDALREALQETRRMVDEAMCAPATMERWLERIDEVAHDALALSGAKP